MDPRAVTTGHPLPPDVGETFRRLWAGGRARWSPAPPAARPDRCSTSPARSRTPSRKADRRGRGGTTPTPAAPQRPRRATTEHAQPDQHRHAQRDRPPGIGIGTALRGRGAAARTRAGDLRATILPTTDRQRQKRSFDHGGCVGRRQWIRATIPLIRARRSGRRRGRRGPFLDGLCPRGYFPSTRDLGWRICAKFVVRCHGPIDRGMHSIGTFEWRDPGIAATQWPRWCRPPAGLADGAAAVPAADWRGVIRCADLPRPSRRAGNRLRRRLRRERLLQRHRGGEPKQGISGDSSTSGPVGLDPSRFRACSRGGGCRRDSPSDGPDRHRHVRRPAARSKPIHRRDRRRLDQQIAHRQEG